MLKQSAAAVLLLISFSLLAKDMNGNFASYGVGARPCSDYIEARQQGEELLDYYNNFVLGYLSAVNLIVPSTFDILGDRSMGAALARLDDHCQRNSDENFTNALALLTGAYYDERKNFKKNKDGWLGSSDNAQEATKHIYK